MGDRKSPSKVEPRETLPRSFKPTPKPPTVLPTSLMPFLSHQPPCNNSLETLRTLSNSPSLSQLSRPSSPLLRTPGSLPHSKEKDHSPSLLQPTMLSTTSQLAFSKSFCNQKTRLNSPPSSLTTLLPETSPLVISRTTRKSRLLKEATSLSSSRTRM